MVIRACGLGYAIGAAVENMGLLDAPLLGAPEAEIRAAHADHALGVVGTACGVVYACALLAGTGCLGSYTPSVPKPGTAIRARTPHP